MKRNWYQINPCQFAHEQAGLDFIKQRLPDRDPYHAWANFEFVDPFGNIYEVDLLLLTPSGFYHIELKHWEGTITGDNATWTLERKGYPIVKPNPRILAERKSKGLKSLLLKEMGAKIPYLDSIIFLHHDTVKLKLPDHLMKNVYGLKNIGSHPDIIEAISPSPRQPLRYTAETARMVRRGMDKLGIKFHTSKALGAAITHKALRDHNLLHQLDQGDHWQEWLAERRGIKLKNRIRIYPYQSSKDSTEQELQSAVHRAFAVLAGLDHPSILKPSNYELTQLGPALIFDHFPNEIRLDYYLKEKGDGLSIDTRLHLVRTLLETLVYAHANQLFHRALAPGSILVLDPASPAPRLKITNWESASRIRHNTEGLSITGTSNVERLLDPAALVYLAPETNEPHEEPFDESSLDIFALGALMYLIFTGRAPADNVAERNEKLRLHGGFKPSLVLDGVGRGLEDLVLYATCPGPDMRHNLLEIREYLQIAEDEFTRPDNIKTLDLTHAQKGDMFEGGWRVCKRLGHGATSIVFHVEKDDQQLVLKLADDPRHNETLQAEGRVLAKLRASNIITFHKTIELSGHTGLLLQLCERGTLSEYLRSQGRLQADLLERFGNQLLEAVAFLEESSIEHRDIKPDNIGLTEKNSRLHLLLFDFSLVKIPLDDLNVGTRPYMDPFLNSAGRKVYDRHAENYSLALTLYKMATGVLPRWPDGVAPGTSGEAIVDAELFDRHQRPALASFFSKALHADTADRFNTIYDMRRAWEDIFRGQQQAETGRHGQGIDLDKATLETSINEISLSSRALAALERRNITTVAELVATRVSTLVNIPGVADPTRRELSKTARYLAQRFPEAREAAPSKAEHLASGLDSLVLHLLPRGLAENENQLFKALLGIDDLDSSAFSWPTYEELASRFSMSRAKLENLLNDARKLWQKSSRTRFITQLRNDIAEILSEFQGLAPHNLVCESLLARHGSRKEGRSRLRGVLACLRAACEVEGDKKQPRWQEKPMAGCVLLAADEDDSEQTPLALRRFDYARDLGKAADQMAASESLPGPQRVNQVLAEVPVPYLLPKLPEERRLQIATAVARTAALSSLGELYPRGMEAKRAVKLARGGLLGLAEITEEHCRQRVEGRYPEAEKLPRGKDLVKLLKEQGIQCAWAQDLFDGDGGISFRLTDESTGTQSSSLRSAHRLLGETTASNLLQARLDHCLHSQGYLILCAPPSVYAQALMRLKKLPLRVVDGDRLLIEAMKEQEKRVTPTWQSILLADAQPRDHRHFKSLVTQVVQPAQAEIERALSGSAEPLLFINIGLWLHYRLEDSFARLRDRCGVLGGIPGLILLIPADGRHETPVLDGVTLSAITNNQWAVIGKDWLEPGWGECLPP